MRFDVIAIITYRLKKLEFLMETNFEEWREYFNV